MADVWSHELGERKAAGLQREGNPFLSAKSGRGREQERVQQVGTAHKAAVRRSPGLPWESSLLRTFGRGLEEVWKSVLCLSKDKRSAGSHSVELTIGKEVQEQGR